MSTNWLDSLKQVNFNELDVNNVGSWPLPVRIIACILVFILTLGAGYWFYISDITDTLAQEEQKEQTLKQEFETKARQASNLKEYTEQMALMQTSFEALLKQLPADTEVPGLLEDITSAGLKSGLEFDQIRLLPEVSSQFYVELPIQVRVEGGYHELATFISVLSSLPRIVTVHDFTIKPTTNKGASGSKLAMDVVLKTYRYNEQGGRR